MGSRVATGVGWGIPGGGTGFSILRDDSTNPSCILAGTGCGEGLDNSCVVCGLGLCMFGRVLLDPVLICDRGPLGVVLLCRAGCALVPRRPVTLTVPERVGC
jgi:hypothetical protein